MQQDSNKKKGKGYRVRPASAREQLNGRTRRVCSILGLAAVVLASAVVVHSLYVIQIRDGAKYRQYAAQQQLLDTTVKATRGEIYDANGITLASTSVEEAASRLGLMKIDPSQITYIRLNESGALERQQSPVRQWTSFIYNGAVTILGTVK